MMLEIFGEEYASELNTYYPDERSALNALVEYTGIPKHIFYRAAYDRDSLIQLARLMEGKERNRPKFLALIMNLMDESPTELKKFLNGGDFSLHYSQFRNVFHHSLLNDAKTNFRPEILNYLDVTDFGLRLKAKNQ